MCWQRVKENDSRKLGTWDTGSASRGLQCRYLFASVGSRRVVRFTWFPPWSWYRAGPQAGSVNGVLMVLGSQAAPKLSWRDGGRFPACSSPLPSEHSSEVSFWLGPRMAWSSEPAPPEGPGGTAGPQWGLGGSRRQRSLNCWHLQALIHPGCLTPSSPAPPPAPIITPISGLPRLPVPYYSLFKWLLVPWGLPLSSTTFLRGGRERQVPNSQASKKPLRTEVALEGRAKSPLSLH